ncbi:MAG TPA: O-antigen ligase family protein [Oscillatoriaceae cyanobacterium M33_DOE_052]|uniref:O-antigen ligase family protein n=1 Tax=Planktothricoides sp. SpSt-374 TaxID=2282167 RepID=A0A7C3ZNA9_9CYAN|nr:O-antigen ligase family protein [Oscillatoriaceae cyanobacterium M33_DOE_052]
MYLHPLIRSAVRLSLGLEQAFTVFALLMFTGAFEMQFKGGLRDLSYFAIYGASFCFILAHWKKCARGLFLGGKFPLILVLVAVASFFWSIEPPTTQKFARELVGTTLFALYFGTRYTYKEQLRLLGFTFGLAGFFCLLYGFGLRNYGVMSGVHGGAWRGIYRHKNAMATQVVLATAVFWVLAHSDIKKRWVAWLGFFLSVFLVFQTKSGGGRVGFLTVMMMVPILQGLRFRYGMVMYFLIVTVLSGGVAGTLFVDNLDAFFEALDKSPDLSGRVPLWKLMFPLMAQKPWLGYGFKSFWISWRGPSAVIWRNVRWRPLYGHNGFIDLTAELGFLGLGIFLIGFILTIKRGVSWIHYTRTAESLWPMMFITILILNNISETRLLVGNSMPWLLYVSISLWPPVQYADVGRQTELSPLAEGNEDEEPARSNR